MYQELFHAPLHGVTHVLHNDSCYVGIIHFSFERDKLLQRQSFPKVMDLMQGQSQKSNLHIISQL